MRAGMACFPHGLGSLEDMLFLKGCEAGMSFDEINKMINESLKHLDETRSE